MSLIDALTPRPEILLTQGVVFLVGVVCIRYFFVSPLMRLYAERQKRSAGRVTRAYEVQKVSEERVKEFESLHAQMMREAQEQYRLQVLKIQQESQKSLHEAQQEAHERIQKMKHTLKEEYEKERDNIPHQAKILGESIFQKLTIVSFFIFFLISFSSPLKASPHDEGPSITLGSLGWPLLNFLVFLGMAIYYGRKPLAGLLKGRQERIGLKLKEAQEQLSAAEKKLLWAQNQLAELDSLRQKTLEQYQSELAFYESKLQQESLRSTQFLQGETSRMIQDGVEKYRQALKIQLVQEAMGLVETKLSEGHLQNLDGHFQKEMNRVIPQIKIQEG